LKRSGKSVAARKRPHVALLIETSLGSGRDILRGIARYVREHEAWALYHEPHGMGDIVPPWLHRWQGDGIIARIQTRDMATQLAQIGVPVIDVLGLVPGLPFPLVHVDNGAIARMAAAHLVERGFRRFGYFGIEGENWSAQRYAAFSAAVADVQSSVPAYSTPRDAAGRRSWERAQDRLARWVSELPKPAGVLVCSDQRGPQFLEACRRAGVSVPDEVAVLGVDNDEPLCEVCLPPLSSIQANHVQVGYQAAALLDRLRVGAAAPPATVLVDPQQVVARLSTDVLSINDPAIAAALRLIREHAHERIQIDAIAHQVGLSRSVLQRNFRALLNRSVHDEILATRIRRARELLAGTDLPLAVVAQRAGFTHQEYMGAVFKAHVGKTPARIRKEDR